LNIPLADHQVKWCEDLNSVRENLLVLAPTDSGKTTIFSIANPIHELCKDPDLRIIIATNSKHLAEGIASAIKWNFESNEMLIRLFGHLSGPGLWRQNEFKLKRRLKSKDSSVYAVSVNSAVKGCRADKLVCDDLVDQKNSVTQEKREKVIEWFYDSLLPRLEPHGSTQAVGTVEHEDDLYNEIQKDNYKVIRLDGIADESKKLTYWPEKFSWEFFENEKFRRPDLFYKHRRNIFYPKLTIIASRSKCEECLDSSRVVCSGRPKEYFDKIVLSIDPAKGSANPRSSWTGIFISGIRKEERIILDLIENHLPYPQLKALIKNKILAFSPNKVYIEGNAVQEWLAQDLNLPNMEVTYTTTAKNSLNYGIGSLGMLIENHQIVIPYGNADSKEKAERFIKQIIYYPRYSSDLLMAWYIAERGEASFEKPTKYENVSTLGRWRPVSLMH